MIKLLNEMSRNRRYITDTLVNKSSEVWEHLVKIYFLQNHSAQGHWKDEVYSFLHKVPKMKNNKYPKEDFIFYNTYNSWCDMLDDFVRAICIDFKCEYDKDRVEEVKTKCEKYFIWLSKQLSFKGVVSKEEVLNELNKLND